MTTPLFPQDPLEKKARIAMIKTYGQTPKQLFRHPHPLQPRSLTPDRPELRSPPVLDSVVGLRWGDYIGSPTEPAPTVVWRARQKAMVAKLLPLASNEVNFRWEIYQAG